MSSPPAEITRLLLDWVEGDKTALERLMPLIYDELHMRARRYLRRERDDHTLQPSALVNEAFLRLVGQDRTQWQNRTQFFAVSAKMMRRVLVDYGRKRQAARRGAGAVILPLEEVVAGTKGPTADVVDLDNSLQALADFAPRQSQVVELRFFGGLTVEEVAEVLGISPATVKTDWSMARAWLFRELRGE